MARTVTDIIPPSRRHAMEQAKEEQGPETPPRQPMPRIRTNHSFPWGTAFIALIVVIACVGALYFFSGATVAVEPRADAGSVSGSYTATPASGSLPFTIISVQKTASESVPAESTVTASDTAHGTITIYNEQTKPQALVKNTRFQTPEGLVFRVRDAVTVPAAGSSGPGTLSATVYADSPGADYNIAASTFTLPGLTDPAQAKQVYAKSAAGMTGGFSGTRPAVSQATDDREHSKLASTLSSQVETEVRTKMGEGYVLVPGAIFTTYTPQSDTADGKGGVLVSEQVDAVAVVFPEEALARAMAPFIIGNDYNGEPLSIESTGGLTLSPNTNAAPDANSPFSFSLSGTATLVWKVDASKVAGAVAGKSRASAQSVLTGFKEIAEASLELKPFWTQTFPSDPSEIKVTVVSKGSADK